MKRYSSSTINWVTRLAAVLLLILVGEYLSPSQALSGSLVGKPGVLPQAAAQANNNTLYLPLVIGTGVGHPPPAHPTLLGVYPSGFIGDSKVIDSQVAPLDQWASPAARNSIVGTFISIEDQNPAYDVLYEAEVPWGKGYTPFFNLETSHKTSEITSGQMDNYLDAWVRGYKSFTSKGGGRFAYIALLQEMNSCQQGGCWTTYGGDPSAYKAAYIYIWQFFHDRGVLASQVRWVFAPNGWSSPDYDHSFEDYYPGDAYVDVVGFSAYNFGDNPPSVWQSPEEVFNPAEPGSEGYFIDRMKAMAPSKPIFITQTGSSSRYNGASNPTMKNEWLNTAYQYLNQKGVWAVLYFNLPDNTHDWPFFVPGGATYQGYKDGILGANYEYYSPADLSGMTLQP